MVLIFNYFQNYAVINIMVKAKQRFSLVWLNFICLNMNSRHCTPPPSVTSQVLVWGGRQPEIYSMVCTITIFRDFYNKMHVLNDVMNVLIWFCLSNDKNRYVTLISILSINIPNMLLMCPTMTWNCFMFSHFNILNIYFQMY